MAAVGSPRRRSWSRWLTAVLLLGALPACQTQPFSGEREYVATELQQRMFHDLAAGAGPGEVTLPPGIEPGDGLTEEEAVALALWNNRPFQATLANLGIARGDLVQAGLLTNPQLNLLFPPIGSKQLEWTLFMPLDALLLRKQRVEIAERDFQRIADELVQNGLDVARDARVAFADFEFAAARFALAEEEVALRSGIADLAQKRFAAGDTGELEALAAHADAHRSRGEAAGLRHAVQAADARLKNVLGIAISPEPLWPVTVDPPVNLQLDPHGLVSEALVIRPDMKAARIAVQAASYRVELAQRSFLRLDAVADGNHGGVGPNNVGPGLRCEIPLFNRNEGLILRSQWSVDQANHNFYAVRDRVVTEVQTSWARVEQARANLLVLRSSVLPVLQDSIHLAEKAYQGGGEGYLLVLQATSQYLNSRLRELELKAELRRSLAELERSVGRRVILPHHGAFAGIPR